MTVVPTVPLVSLVSLAASRMCFGVSDTATDTKDTRGTLSAIKVWVKTWTSLNMRNQNNSESVGCINIKIYPQM